MLSQDLKDKVQDYLAGDVAIADLEQWIVERMRRYLADPESADADIVCAIEQGLALMSDGIMTETEFRESLSETLALHSLILAPPATTSTSSTGNTRLPCSLSIAESESAMVLTCLS